MARRDKGDLAQLNIVTSVLTLVPASIDCIERLWVSSKQ